jgi:glycogen synthase
MSRLTPEYDNKIAKKYSSSTINHKLENKTALQAMYGKEENSKKFSIGIMQTIEESHLALLQALLPGIKAIEVDVYLIARGTANVAQTITTLQKDYSNLTCIHDDEAAIRQMYAGCDASLFLNDCEQSEELQYALHYGTVPICPQNSTVENYNAIQEKGNAFTFVYNNVWLVFASIVRALETFQFPYDYKTIQKLCMQGVHEEDEEEENA